MRKEEAKGNRNKMHSFLIRKGMKCGAILTSRLPSRLCAAGCVVVELLTGSSICALLISAQCELPLYLKGIVSSLDAHITESTNQ